MCDGVEYTKKRCELNLKRKKIDNKNFFRDNFHLNFFKKIFFCVCFLSTLEFFLVIITSSLIFLFFKELFLYLFYFKIHWRLHAYLFSFIFCIKSIFLIIFLSHALYISFLYLILNKFLI